MTCTNWKKLAIFEVAEVITGTTPITSDKNNYGADIPFVSPRDLGNQKYIVSAEKYLSLKGANKARIVPYGSTLFTCIGSTIGKVGIAGKPLTTNQQINAAIPKHISAEFLYYSLCYISEKVKRIAGIQAVPIINKSEFESQILHIPTCYNMQNQIAAILSTWDQAIEKTESLITVKEKRLFQLIKSLISNKCETWDQLRADKIFDSISDKCNSNAELLSVTQDRGVIPRTMLEGRVMSPEGSTDSYKLIKEGDFAISLRSFQGGIEYSRYQGLISPAYTVLRPKLKIHNDFYRHFFKSYLFIEKYLNIAVIGIRDGKQISIPDFMTVKLPLPPFDQQKRIASILNIAREEIDLLKKQANTYCKQKRGLMQILLTGQSRVKLNMGVM